MQREKNAVLSRDPSPPPARANAALRPLALPAVNATRMAALREATSDFGVTLVYDVYQNFFGTDLVNPISEGRRGP